jgi:hypothetical protein
MEMGSSVNIIGDYGFAGCSGIIVANIKPVFPPNVSSNTFNEVSRTAIIKVPCGSVPYYYAAQYWNVFTNIQENPDCASVEEKEFVDLDLYPTTVSDILNITSSETISEIEIVNVMGQVVRRIEVNADNAICNVNNLPNGIYVVRIRTLRHAQGAEIQRKFIKE